MSESILPYVFGIIGFIVFAIMFIRDSQTFKTIKLIGKPRANRFNHLCKVLYHSQFNYFDRERLEQYDSGKMITSFVNDNNIYGHNYTKLVKSFVAIVHVDHRVRIEKSILNGYNFENRFKHTKEDSICDTIDHLCDKMMEYIEFYEQKSSYIDLAKKYKVNV